MSFYVGQSDEDDFDVDGQTTMAVSRPEQQTFVERGYCTGRGSRKFESNLKKERTNENHYLRNEQELVFSEFIEQCSYQHQSRAPLPSEKQKRHRAVSSSSSDDDGDHRCRNVVSMENETDSARRLRLKRERRNRKRDRQNLHVDEGDDDQSQPSTTSEFPCNTEKWTFYDPEQHKTSQDCCVFWTKPDKGYLSASRFRPSELAKFELTNANHILGANEDTLMLFGKMRRIVRTAKHPVPGRILFGPMPMANQREIATEFSGVVELSDVYSQGVIEDTALIEKEITKVSLDLQRNPHAEDSYARLIELEKTLLDKRRLCCAAKEFAEVLKAYSTRMVNVWQKFSKNCPHDLSAITGYLSRFAENTKFTPELRKGVDQFIVDRMHGLPVEVDFWRTMVEKVYWKMSKSVLDYVEHIDAVIERFRSRDRDEQFIAELILLRTRVLFESGHIPSVVATVQLYIEMFDLDVVKQYSREEIQRMIQEDLRDFWESGYPRKCDVLPDEIHKLFPNVPPGSGFAQYLERRKTTDGLGLATLVDEDEARRFIETIQRAIDEVIRQAVMAIPPETPEAHVWLQMEEVRSQILWHPLVPYGSQEIRGVLTPARVPFERIHPALFVFKDTSVGRRLLLDMFGLFGTDSPPVYTTVDNVFTQMGIPEFQHPSIGPELIECSEWIDRSLTVLSEMQGNSDDSNIFAYTRVMTAVQQMAKSNSSSTTGEEKQKQFKEFGNSDSDASKRFSKRLKTSVLICATIDATFNKFDVDILSVESASFDTHQLLEPLVTKIIENAGQYEPDCLKIDVGLKKITIGSVFALRTYARLLATCPDSDDYFQPAEGVPFVRSLSRQHLFDAVLGYQITTANRTKDIAKTLKKAFYEAVKIPSTGHILGEKATYLGFYLAVADYVSVYVTLISGCQLSGSEQSTSPIGAFSERITNLKEKYPQFFDTAIFAELVMQFLWKRQETTEKIESREEVLKLNERYCETYPTNTALLKLLLSNGCNEGKITKMRRKILSKVHKDPLVNIVRAFGAVYMSAIRAGRVDTDYVDIMEQEKYHVARSSLRKMMTQNINSSSFVSVYLRQEGGTTANFHRDLQRFPFSKVMILDYVCKNPGIYKEAVLQIFHNRGMLGLVRSYEATAMMRRVDEDHIMEVD